MIWMAIRSGLGGHSAGSAPVVVRNRICGRIIGNARVGRIFRRYAVPHARILHASAASTTVRSTATSGVFQSGAARLDCRRLSGPLTKVALMTGRAAGQPDAVVALRYDPHRRPNQ